MVKLLLYGVALVAIIGAVSFLVWNPPKVDKIVMVTTESPRVLEIKDAALFEETNSYTVSAHYPQIGVAAFDALVKEKIDAAVATFKAYPTDVPSVDSMPKNELDISYNSVYTGQDFVSVELLVSEYTGGAHPNSVVVGVNVDRNTEKEVSLDAALALTGKTLNQIADLADQELRAKLEDAYFEEGAAAKTENYSTFLIDGDFVTFIFNVYQVGPYAAGPQEFKVARVR